MGKDEMHLHFLKEYGVGTYIQVKNEAKHIIESLTKYYEIISENEEFTEYLILKSSSDMNTAEFSKLLKGVIRECEDQGIRTLETEELERMIEESIGKK